MYREHLDADAGMLFVFEQPRVHAFWMKNTLIPLDMIFIGADRRIVGIVENAEPQDADGARRCGAPSQYVLEIGGGLSARLGIRAGQPVEFQRRVRAAPVSRRAMQPMLATLADAPLRDPHLVYEPKYDGIRALIDGHAGAAGTSARRSRSRRALGNDKTAQFPEVVRALGALGRGRRGRRPLLDGEIVALDAPAQPTGFQRIQDRIHLTDAREIVAPRGGATRSRSSRSICCATGDEDLCALPLAERRARLEAALAPALDGAAAAVARRCAATATALMAEARAEGWEGLVVKDARSPYRPGRRTLEWRKLKLVKRAGVRGRRLDRAARRAQLVRRAAARRARSPAAAALRRPRRRRLHRGGARRASAALLAALETASCPFDDASAVTNERPHWVRPELVAEVQFAEWTDDGIPARTRSTSACATTSAPRRDRRESARRASRTPRRRRASADRGAAKLARRRRRAPRAIASRRRRWALERAAGRLRAAGRRPARRSAT